MKNHLLSLENFGQSIWLDYIQRSFVALGGLRKLVQQDGVKGLTSNPAIFAEAIANSNDYDHSIAELALANLTAEEIFFKMAMADVRNAADEFAHVYQKSGGVDGYVSLEVSPALANDTSNSVAQAKKLWRELDRKNVMIKIPATREGLPAVSELIAEGININVTLLFDVGRYRKVAEAYVSGLEERLSKGGRIENIASVASFFLSRIDSEIDPMLDKIISERTGLATEAKYLKGKIAIASAKEAYQVYRSIFESERFKRLELEGARPQRLLWASTGTKNSECSDVLYVDSLIGRQTVSTLPMPTLEAFRDHGIASASLEEKTAEARLMLYHLEGLLGIRMAKVGRKLEAEGLKKFNAAFENVLELIETKKRKVIVL